MKDKERGKEYAKQAVTESAVEVVEALHRTTQKEAKKLGICDSIRQLK